MRFRSVYLILILFVAVTLYIFFGTDGLITSEDERPVRSRRKILSRKAEDIERIVFVSDDSTYIDIAREGAQWYIKRPIEAKGSLYSIDNLIEALTGSITFDVIYGVKDFAQFGLEDPRVSIIVYGEGPAPPDTILVGNKAPTNTMCYTRVGTAPEVILTNEITEEILDKTLFHFRNKKLVLLDTREILKVEISSETGRLSIVKSSEGWRLAGTPFEIDGQIMEDYTQILERTLIYGFLPVDRGDYGLYGLDKRARRISLSTAKDSVEIYLGKRSSDKIYALEGKTGEVLLVGSDIAMIFNHPTGSIVSLGLTSLSTDEVSSAEISLPLSDSRFISNEFGWVAIDSLGSRSIDSGSIEGIITTLNSLRFADLPSRRFQPEEIEASDEDTYRLDFNSENGDRLETVILVEYPNGMIKGGSLTTGFFGQIAGDGFLDLKKLLEEASGSPH